MTATATETPVELKPWPDVAALVAKAIAGGAVLPEQTDLIWAWRSCNRDLTSSHGYRWPWPGQWAESPDDGRSLAPTGYPCPDLEHGGLCLAKTVSGAASGGIALGTALLCGYVSDDLLGEDQHKLRVRRAYVLDVVDLLADLGGANLRYADLRYANLRYADLGGANLGGADLGGANLRYANLRCADLGGADLRYANLRYANLRYADLGGANLRYADLGGANLRYANLRCADLGGANLRCADLRYADLGGADLGGANYSPGTLWPTGSDITASGAVLRP